VRSEEHTFFLDCFLNRDLVNDIFLGSVFYTNEAKSQGDFLVHNHTLCVGSSVHNINFGNDTNSTDTLGIQLLSHLQTIRSGHISISRYDDKNDGTWVGHVPVTHGTSDLLNVLRLIRVSETDLGDTW